jgi:hypothetical protein
MMEHKTEQEQQRHATSDRQRVLAVGKPLKLRTSLQYLCRPLRRSEKSSRTLAPIGGTLEFLCGEAADHFYRLVGAAVQESKQFGAV